MFYSEVINLRDMLTYQGQSVQELRQAFREPIEENLAFCAERSKEAETPISGTFTIHISPELHREIAVRAKLVDQSLDEWMTEVLAASVERVVG